MVNGVVGIPHRQIGYPTFWSCLAALRKPSGTQIVTVEGTSVAKQRNVIVERALEMGARWVLFADDDHVFPVDSLYRLLGHGKGVVGATCSTRTAPHFITAAIVRDNIAKMGLLPEEVERGGLMKVDGIGMGLTLVRLEVFKAIQPPWFEVGRLKSDEQSEDIDFCRKAGKAGFPIYVDLDLRIGHLTLACVVPRSDGDVMMSTVEEAFKSIVTDTVGGS